MLDRHLHDSTMANRQADCLQSKCLCTIPCHHVESVRPDHSWLDTVDATALATTPLSVLLSSVGSSYCSLCQTNSSSQSLRWFKSSNVIKFIGRSVWFSFLHLLHLIGQTATCALGLLALLSRKHPNQQWVSFVAMASPSSLEHQYCHHELRG